MERHPPHVAISSELLKALNKLLRRAQ